MRKVNDPIVSNGPLKVLLAWTSFGITSWAEAAGFFATIYSLIMIGEWLYKFWKKRKSNEPKS